MKRLFSSALLAVAFFFATAQETEKAKEEEGMKGSHRISLVLGHTHIFKALDEEGNRAGEIFPSVGFDYDYWLSNRWAIGIQNDLVIETFEVELNDKRIIKRSNPVSSVVTLLFKPKNHFTFMTGIGAEFSKEENIGIARIGTEASWPLKNKWEFGVSLLYDFKWKGYDTWVFGFGISKIF